MFGKQNVRAYELFREATSKKRSGNIEGAIVNLRKAKELAKDEDTIYTVEEYLRLPIYLQEAGKSDEAWREFQLLITYGYPKQLKVNGLAFFDLSSIYDKMRLFLQRENKYIQAVEFGVLSYASKLAAIRIQRNDKDSGVADMRKKEAIIYDSEDNIRKMLKPLLKKASAEAHMDLLSKRLSDSLLASDKIDLQSLALVVRYIIKG